MTKTATKTTTKTIFSPHLLQEELKREGKILNLHPGFVELISDKVITNLEKWLKNKPIVTEDDINQKITKELQKYHKDLAYLYQNHNKII